MIIFIQARLNSKRYPKKIIKKIKNKTFIEIMMSRLKELNKKYQIIFLIPNDKKNAPGVIDSTTNFVEHPEVVKNRILTFSKVMDAEQLLAGTDC